MKYILINFIIFICYSLGAQNLVLNPSFEENHAIPACSDEFGKVKYWYNPTVNTPDYIHRYATGTSDDCPFHQAVQAADNWLGKQDPNTGDAYVALHSYLTGSSVRAKEYIGIKLTQPLQKGRKYVAGMYLSAADRTGYRTNGVSMLFTVDSTIAFDTIVDEPQIFPHEIIYDTLAWYPFRDTFVADKSYRYLTLGNFFKDTNDVNFLIDGPFGWAWVNTSIGSYYVDDVFVTPLPLQKPDLGSDRVICSNSSTTFSSNVTASNYIWNTGETSPSITVSEPGEYVLCVSSFGETKCDTVNLGNVPAPDIELGEDMAVCLQDSFKITLSLKPFSGAWSTGVSGKEITVSNYGTYHVTVTNETNCRDKDSITIYEKCPDCLDELSINPNPVSDILSFKVLYNTNDKCSYYVIDAKGRIVIRQEGSFSSGYNYRNLDCNNLQSGNYILVIESKCGKLSKVFQKL